MVLQRSNSVFRAGAMVRLLVVLAIGLALAWSPTPALAKKGQNDNVRQTEQARREAQRRKQVARFEINWLKKSLNRHARIIQLAMDEAAQTSLTQLRTFAQEFIERETREMTLLQGWLLQWYNITHVPRIVSDDDENDELSDEEFLERVIDYEQAEISQAKIAGKKAGHLELRRYARVQIRTNRIELEILRAWLEILNEDDDDDDEDDDDDDDDD